MMQEVEEKPSAAIEEVVWRDDSIRWEGGLRVGGGDKKKNEDDGSESDDDQEFLIDPFADPNPFEVFSFDFHLPANVSNDGDGSKKMQDTVSETNSKKTISIQIRGYKTDAEEIWQSTGLTLWRASDYLCEYQVEQYKQLFSSNKRVLELGAGLGLNGILAWKLMMQQEAKHDINISGDGSRNQAGEARTGGEVCITDGDSDALVHLRDNVERNRPTSSSSINSHEETMVFAKVHQLIWGKESSEKFLKTISDNTKYDVLLASDIIYSPVIVEPLWETVQTLLDTSGVFVMAFARRKVPVSIDLVLSASVEKGFGYQLVKEDLDEGIWVYEFRFDRVNVE